MRQSDYLWVLIQRTNTTSKSKSKKFKSPTHSNVKKITQPTKYLVKNSEQQRSLSKEKQDLRRMRELQKQNRILKKQNQVLKEYFYTMDKAQTESERKNNQILTNEGYQQNISAYHQTFMNPSVFVQRSHYSKVPQNMDKNEQRAEATTVHSYEDNPHKIYNFGWSGNEKGKREY